MTNTAHFLTGATRPRPPRTLTAWLIAIAVFISGAGFCEAALTHIDAGSRGPAAPEAAGVRTAILGALWPTPAGQDSDTIPDRERGPKIREPKTGGSDPGKGTSPKGGTSPRADPKPPAAKPPAKSK